MGGLSNIRKKRYEGMVEDWEKGHDKEEGERKMDKRIRTIKGIRTIQ